MARSVTSRRKANPPGALLIELRNVTKIYGQGEAEVRALDGINLRIDEGEFAAVMGPSGSGKSTAMNIIGCLDLPTTGNYLFNGVEATDLDAIEEIVASGRQVEAADDVHGGGLARAGRPHHRGKLALVNAQIDAVKRADFRFPLPVDLGDVPQLDEKRPWRIGFAPACHGPCHAPSLTRGGIDDDRLAGL